MPPRVAMLTSYPPDHASFTGGVQTATAALVEGLARRTDEVELHVVSSSALEADVHERRGGVHFHFLAAPGLRPRFPWRVVAARRALKRIDPDLVHCQDTLVLAVAGLRGRWRKLFSIHGVKRAEARLRTGWERPSAAFEALRERWVHRRYDALVCNSSYAAAIAPARARTFEVPNAVASELFGLTRSPAGDRLVFVGALAPLKRPRDLVDAHAALLGERPSLTTSFCGPAEDAGYAAEMRRASPRGVVWEGVVTRARLLELLAHATAVVLPSRQENVPMVIAEAMAAGVPVVATRVGGVPEMVGDGVTGFLYEPGDTGALVERLGKLLADPALVARMGDAGRQRARERYSPPAVAAATIGVYRELLGGSS